MSADQATLAHYARSVPYYTHAFDASYSRHLDAFLDRIPIGSHILELGCGTGRDAARMIERGFRVDPTDGTPAMVAKARERYGVHARLMRFDQLASIDEYDAIWAHACLIHAPREALGSILAAIFRALRSGGLHHASFKQGEDEIRDDRGRLNSRFTEHEVAEHYATQGFEMIELYPWQGAGADGEMRDWLAITVEKP